MIIKIHKSSPTHSSSFLYNEDKVKADVADILHTENMGGIVNPDEIEKIFIARDRASFRDDGTSSFQMTINPGENDTIREDQIPDLVRDMMEGLGFNGQPWVIFKHRDIERIHYHVVSTRIKENGRRIDNFKMFRKCSKLAKSLEQKYGFVIGAATKKRIQHRDKVVFEPGILNVADCIMACVEDSLKYQFTTEAQFMQILKSHRVCAQESVGSNGLATFFQGLDWDGVACTPRISDTIFGKCYYIQMHERIKENMAADMSDKGGRIGKLIKKADSLCPDYVSLVKFLSKMNIDLSIFRDAAGVPRGITVIDHDTMCAFKMSDLSKSAADSILSKIETYDAEKEEREINGLLNESVTGLGKDDSLITETLFNAISSVLASASSESNSADLREKKKKKKKKKTIKH